jgi:aryl-alcohol dehydrogenase-like predicted oxidoreductase
MERRVLGKTNERLSIVGFGGMLVRDETQETANRLVAQAIERGVNYFDVAPSYGNAQERLGPALKSYRQDVFLACKTLERFKGPAIAELRESLRLLQTDYIDLYQFHAISTAEDVAQITGAGGALEAFEAARRDGVIRYIGCSAHSEDAALALLDRAELDSVLYPINYVCWHQGQFGRRLLEAARQRGMGILALKAMARRALKDDETRIWSKCWYAPAETFEEAKLALRFTLSRPVTAALTPGHEQFFRWACDIADAFRPLSAAEEALAVEHSAGLQPLFPLQDE